MIAARFTWREWSALAALLLVLIVNLPIFLCMAPWVDATFYDVCARTMQRGGVLYRDTFDTNLPGMAWLHLAVRSLFGWRSEVIRAADFLVVAAIAFLLTRWDQAMSRSARIWTAVFLLAYYFSTSEWCQNQRDVWMLLPCLAALYLRRRQLLSSRSGWRTFLVAGLEGLLWGAAVWIKPMAIVPAFACWVVSVGCRRPLAWRAVLWEGTGLLVGGLIAGGAGILWLWRSGAWTPFWDIMLNWNPEYRDFCTRWPQRWKHLKFWCVTTMPWCLVHLAAFPLAGIALARALGPRKALSAERISQALLATLYLSWIVQVLTLQGWYPYHLTPPVLLGVVLTATWLRIPAQPWWRFAYGFHVLLFTALALFTHPVLQPQRLANWWACLMDGSSAQLRNNLALTPQQGITGGASDWSDLERVAAFLRDQEVRPDEMICLHESTMPLYLELDRTPPVRYLFFGQAVGVYRAHRDRMIADLSSSRARYVVSDLMMSGWRPRHARRNDEECPDFPKALAESFPWSEPILFHSGRYAVHKRSKPIRKL